MSYDPDAWADAEIEARWIEKGELAKHVVEVVPVRSQGFADVCCTCGWRSRGLVPTERAYWLAEEHREEVLRNYPYPNREVST